MYRKITWSLRCPLTALIIAWYPTSFVRSLGCKLAGVLKCQRKRDIIRCQGIVLAASATASTNVLKLSLTVNMNGLHCASFCDVEDDDLPHTWLTTSTEVSRCRCAVMDWGGTSATSTSSISVFKVPFFFLEALGFSKDGESFSDCLHLWPHLAFFGGVLIWLMTGMDTKESTGGTYESSMKVIS